MKRPTASLEYELVTGTASDHQDPLWRIWRNLWQRVTGPHRMHWYYRHCSICDEWRIFKSFAAWAKAAGWKKGMDVHRTSGTLYSPSTCIIASHQHTMRHTRRAVLCDIGGTVKPLAEWCDIHGACYCRAWFLLKKKHLPADVAVMMAR